MTIAPGKISLIYGTFVDSNDPNFRAVPDQLKASSSDFINELKTASIDLLKIDVEGYEIKVLEGACKSLAEKKIRFIYLETGLDDRFNSIQSLIDFVKPLGYLPYAFYDQTT